MTHVSFSMGDDESDKLVDKSHDFDRRIRINISREKIAEEEPEQRLSKSSSRTSILSKGSDDRHLSDCQVWMFEKLFHSMSLIGQLQPI